jgi:ornithine--oxo-acid transaminase
LAAAVGREAVRVILEEGLVENAATLGEYFIDQLAEIPSRHVREVRGKGLLVGVELHPQAGGARRFCEALMGEGVLAKETHENVIRFAPPLVIDRPTVDWALERIARVLTGG